MFIWNGEFALNRSANAFNTGGRACLEWDGMGSVTVERWMGWYGKRDCGKMNGLVWEAWLWKDEWDGMGSVTVERWMGWYGKRDCGKMNGME